MDRYSVDWPKIALKAKCDAGWICKRCGWDNAQDYPWNLGVHHKDMDKANNDPSNLEVLCWPCHREIHLKNDPLFYHGEEPEDYWRLNLPGPVHIREVMLDVLEKYGKIQRESLKEGLR